MDCLDLDGGVKCAVVSMIAHVLAHMEVGVCRRGCGLGWLLLGEVCPPGFCSGGEVLVAFREP